MEIRTTNDMVSFFSLNNKKSNVVKKLFYARIKKVSKGPR